MNYNEILLRGLLEENYSIIEFWEKKQKEDGFSAIVFIRKLQDSIDHFKDEIKHKISYNRISQMDEEGNFHLMDPYNYSMPLLPLLNLSESDKGVYIKSHFGLKDLENLEFFLAQWELNEQSKKLKELVPINTAEIVGDENLQLALKECDIIFEKTKWDKSNKVLLQAIILVASTLYNIDNTILKTIVCDKHGIDKLTLKRSVIKMAPSFREIGKVTNYKIEEIGNKIKIYLKNEGEIPHK